QAPEGRHVAPLLQEGPREQRPDHLRRAAEPLGSSQRADGLTRAVVLEERLAQPTKNVARRPSTLSVLHPEPEDLLALLDVAELHAGRAEQAQPLGDQPARLRRHVLPLGRAQEDGERVWPRAEELDHLRRVALLL